MFNFKLEIPTYAEWKVQFEKFMADQPEQAKNIKSKFRNSGKIFLMICGKNNE